MDELNNDQNIVDERPATELAPQACPGAPELPGPETLAADVSLEAAPLAEIAAPSQEEPKPVQEEPQPVQEEPKPVQKEPKEEPKSDKMDWYILKVQSNREESIREGLLRRVAIAGLGYYFDQAIVPTEKVTEFKGGKKKVIKRKLYPGYLVVHMEINDDTWFLVRETPGIGDFTGAAGHPSPMLPHEVARIVAKHEEKSEKAPKLKIAFREGERVKIKEGTFESFEGDVESIDETNGRVTVMINIFGRSTPVELEYWQIEAL
jgi:transcription termination/antitermination protein NusG